ncbi:uncharacterized protein LOC115717678 [Cannabis sativa]|uniref:uncharacterized protein LOC115717678 n=1 Tax=Cannabis sativa TaxID=3483 RepID=UPI0029CA2FD2|nr:uncharacterized protein LOC115717678 [Cannabis sativa]
MVGHFKKSFHQAKKDKQKLEAKPVLAQIFVITQADAAASPSMVRGQLLINNSHFNVLFDFRTIHSYVVSRVINLLGRPYDLLERGFGTLMPSGKLVMPIRIEDRELRADLIELKLTEFDIILGMDFLSKHLANIDYKQKMMTF